MIPTVSKQRPTVARVPGGGYRLGTGPDSAWLRASAADTQPAYYQTQLRTDCTEDVLGGKEAAPVSAMYPTKR